MIQDNYGRGVSYLRLSITDRCNLRCFYCRPVKGSGFTPHKNILTYEDMLYLLQAASGMDIQKVRLTGGEPFVRRDILYFLHRLKSKLPDMEIRLTTNATLIAGKIRALRDIGIKGLNISLDTLDRDKYQRITGQDKLGSVMASIDRCLEEGIRIKINAVALKGVNNDELGDFIRLAMDRPLDVRFIEFMPIGEKTLWEKDYYWSSADLLAQAAKLTDLVPVDSLSLNHGPARMYKPGQGLGRVGVISPLSEHFCATCNRLRVTANGRLRTCLFSDKEYSLLPLIRSPKVGPDRLRLVMERAGRKKPMGHELMSGGRKEKSLCRRVMSSIGG
ncbi:GTP 3',8-cyclase MoaA [Desulfonatronospira sp.]|nr:GTP 3',8-cyclase MoaA [Desulfonatronospira sp.]